MAGKNIPANNKVKGMFYLNSLFPTTAELAGIKAPDSVQSGEYRAPYKRTQRSDV